MVCTPCKRKQPDGLHGPEGFDDLHVIDGLACIRQCYGTVYPLVFNIVFEDVSLISSKIPPKVTMFHDGIP